MARVTVEDCIDKVESPYELVLVAKERAVQLNSGLEPTLDRDNDKNTVISLREIAEETIKVSDLTDSAIHKLRKHVEQVDDGTDDDEVIGDDFDSMYKGEISKSGTPILPSKRARKIPEKIQVAPEDLVEQVDDGTDDDEVIGDDFDSMYKGEISKSGTPILPSKRARKIPEKIQVAPEDLEELTAKAEPEVEVNPELEVASEETEVSLDQIAEAETTEAETTEAETTEAETEAETTEVNSDDSETTNS